MTVNRFKGRMLLAVATVVSIGGLVSVASPSPAAGAGIALVPHRAVYDLKLIRSTGKRSLDAVRGRILYDFSGSSCEGWILNFRQLSELDTGEGKVAVSDLRTSTWEEGAAKSFRFSSQNYVNERPVDMVDGKAERRDDKVAVTLSKPKQTDFDLEGAIVFPTEHLRRVIAAAREGASVVEVAVFDGSETGQKVYNTLTVIGRPLEPDVNPPADAAAGQSALAGLRRWPVTVSYFDRTAKTTGEQTPVYAISFQMYENGVSRALVLDYGDFQVAGEMSRLEIKPDPACP